MVIGNISIYGMIPADTLHKRQYYRNVNVILFVKAGMEEKCQSFQLLFSIPEPLCGALQLLPLFIKDMSACISRMSLPISGVPPAIPTGTIVILRGLVFI